MLKLFIAILPLIALAFFPKTALAHERHLFNISGVDYLFVVGSLNEPVFVGDKTGVDLRVLVADPSEPTNSSAAGATPVIGLGDSLKVELLAGGKSKTLNLSPRHNAPGSYKADFYPTVATSFEYRIFGEINDTEFDYTFSCNPAGHVSDETSERVDISDNVFRAYKAGSFGCPQSPEAVSFPETAPSALELSRQNQELGESLDSTIFQTRLALVLGLINLAVGVVLLKKLPRK